MAKNYKFKLNQSGVRELMKSNKMKSVLDEYANDVLKNLGDGYGTSSGETEERGKVRVFARTFKARKENLDNNTLLKAIGK